MVRSILNFFYQETSKLHQAAFLLAVFSLLSQLLGFIRDRSLAHIFGASADLDIYYAAFRIPDFIFVFVASIVSLSVLVPFIVEREVLGQEKVREFIDNIFSFFTIVIVAVCLAAFVFMPSVTRVLFKGLGETHVLEVVTLSRILLLSPIMLGLSNLFGSITQSYNRFLVYAFAPVLYNLGIIIGIFLFTQEFGVIGVVFGVVIGSLLHLLIQIPFVIRMGLMPRPKIGFDFASIRSVVAISLPRTLTLSVSHISLLFLISLASMMTIGSISIFTFAQNISSVPLSIIGVSYSLAAFPTLSRYFSSNNIPAFVSQMSITLRHIIFWSMPAIALFIVLRAQIVRVILGSGNFDWADTRLTAATLAIFSLSVLSQSILLLFVRAFYSAGHTKKPLVINIVSTIALIALTYVLVKLYYAWPGFGLFVSSLFRVEELSGTVVLMLPLGFSLGTIINSIWHWVAFERDFGSFDSSVYRTLFSSFASAVFVGLGSYVGLNVFAGLFDLSTLLGIFLQGLLSGLLGIVFGVLVLRLLRSPELIEIKEVLHKKIVGVEPVADNPEIV